MLYIFLPPTGTSSSSYYNTLSLMLNAAILDTTFETNLILAAATNSVVGVSAVSAITPPVVGSLQAYAPSYAPSLPPSTAQSASSGGSSTTMIGAVVGSVVGSLVLAVILFFTFYYSKSFKSVKGGSAMDNATNIDIASVYSNQNQLPTRLDIERSVANTVNQYVGTEILRSLPSQAYYPRDASPKPTSTQVAIPLTSISTQQYRSNPIPNEAKNIAPARPAADVIPVSEIQELCSKKLQLP